MATMLYEAHHTISISKEFTVRLAVIPAAPSPRPLGPSAHNKAHKKSNEPTMPKLTAAERNKRKRERKKREREQKRKREEEEAAAQKAAPGDGNGTDTTADATAAEFEVEVEYVAAPLGLPSADAGGGEKAAVGDAGLAAAEPAAAAGAEEGGDDENDISAVLRRFQSRSAVLVTDDEDAKKEDDHADEAAAKGRAKPSGDEEDDLFDADDEGDGTPSVSNRKRRELERPTVAELKNRVKRADLVEAHDVTAPDPDFLVALKSVPGTVPVPRHWGRKRKYLQGKVCLWDREGPQNATASRAQVLCYVQGSPFSPSPSHPTHHTTHPLTSTAGYRETTVPVARLYCQDWYLRRS